LIIWVLLLFLVAVLYDRSTLLKTAGKRDKVLYVIIMGISFVLLILHSFEIPVPSPSEAIVKVLESMLHIKG
jgi:hypothetical protein